MCDVRPELCRTLNTKSRCLDVFDKSWGLLKTFELALNVIRGACEENQSFDSAKDGDP